MKARQLNNRRSKTKSYSPACLRTVQIESKTRRGNCEEPRLEIPPPPPSPGPAPSLAPPSALLPPRPSSPVFVSSLCNPEVEAEGGLQPPAGRCGSSPPLFIGGQRGFHHFSEKSISFSLPHVAAAAAGSNKRQRGSVWLARRGARFPAAATRECGFPRVAGQAAGLGSGCRQGCREEGSHLTLHPT